jgi:hypothetical protein
MSGAKAAHRADRDTVICSVNPRLGQLREPFWTPAPKLASLASVRFCQQWEDPLNRTAFGPHFAAYLTLFGGPTRPKVGEQDSPSRIP